MHRINQILKMLVSWYERLLLCRTQNTTEIPGIAFVVLAVYKTFLDLLQNCIE